MFGQTPTPPGEDSAGQVQQVPTVPPLKVFEVRRLDPASPGVVEEIVLQAHELEFNGAGNILRFLEFMVVQGLPSVKTVRCFNGWIDYREVYDRPSAILSPHVH